MSSRSAIIIAASSGIGQAISRRWVARGWRVWGSYRTRSQAVDELERVGVQWVACDLSNEASLERGCSTLEGRCREWDILVLCPAALGPIGTFPECRFEEWQASVQVNVVSPLRLVHRLLPMRRRQPPPGPCVLFFAGGGTNSAPINVSAYTLSKIALIKMCELLDAEVADTRFVIVGPGVVHTNIHQTTLRAAGVGAGHTRAVEALAGRRCTPMKDVLDCCDWVVDAPRQVVSGRNFSVAHDRWGTPALERLLLEDPEMYKLRRHRNDHLVTP